MNRKRQSRDESTQPEPRTQTIIVPNRHGTGEQELSVTSTVKKIMHEFLTGVRQDLSQLQRDLHAQYAQEGLDLDHYLLLRELHA